jgi:hypothetical protein
MQKAPLDFGLKALGETHRATIHRLNGFSLNFGILERGLLSVGDTTERTNIFLRPIGGISGVIENHLTDQNFFN